MTGTGFQQAPPPLMHSTTTTEFGSFVSNNQPNSLNQQQGTGFNQQQSTGFNQQPLQQQGTGFGQAPSTSFGAFQQNFNQKLNPQITGSYSMPQTSFGNPQQQQQQQALLPQQTGFYNQSSQQQQQTGFLKPNATGYVNSMAQSSNFNNQLIIPNLRLSFVTVDDQRKFEKLFRSKVPIGSNTISGANCREILMRSGLPPKQLAQIWNLSDTLKAGELMFPEFVLAMYLINSVLQGEPLPFALEKKIRDEVTKFVDAINFQIGEAAENSTQQQQQPSNPTPFDNLTNGIQLQPQPTGMMPPTSFGDMSQLNTQPLYSQNTGFMPQTSFGQQQLQQQQQQQGSGFNQNQWNTGLQPQMTGSQAPQTSFGNFNATNTNALRANQTGMGLVAQPTGILPPSNFQVTAPLTAQKTGFGNNDLYSQSNFTSKFTAENEDYVTSEEKALFYKIFETYDTQNTGILDSKTSVEIFRKSGLSRQDLEQIWNLADADNTGKLNKQEFTVGMHLVYRKLNGHALPTVLPRSLVPQSTQIIDIMKDQLKSNTIAKASEPKKQTLNNSSTFKNNDALPSFRNKKSNDKVDIDLELQKQEEEEEQNQLEIKQLSNLIRDKKILIDAEISKNEDRFKDRQLNDLENLKQIEIIKSSIISLPQPASTQDSNLQSSYESLNARLVSVLSSIDAVEEAIINSKIQLFKNQNPSSLVGTGPNGAVTEQDLRKAKKKAALAERMASLTGKTLTSTTSLVEEEAKLKEAIAKIKEESSQNKETVEFIKKDVNELISGIKSNLFGSAGNEDDTKKFDLGIGLESEVKEFIKHLKTTRASANAMSSSLPLQTKPQQQQKENPNQPISRINATSSSANVSEPVREKSFSDFKSAEERAAYIKEQAQKRMNEKLDKMGLGRRNRRNRASVSSSPSTAAVESTTEEMVQPLPVKSSFSEPISQEPKAQVNHMEEEEDDEEDEEEKALRERLESLRLKKIQKQERILKMQREIEEAEREESLSETVKAPTTSNEVLPEKVEQKFVDVGVPQNSAAKIEDDEWNDEPAPPVQQPVQQTTQHHKFNPFARGSATANLAQPKAPFFQQPASNSSSQLSFDSKAAEEQRKMQRGIDNDSDDWSDDEDEPKTKSKLHPAVIPPAPVAPSFSPPAPVAPSFSPPAPVAPSFSPPAPVAPSFSPPAPVAPSFSPPAPVAPSFIPPAPVAPSFTSSAPVAPPLQDFSSSSTQQQYQAVDQAYNPIQRKPVSYAADDDDGWSDDEDEKPKTQQQAPTTTSEIPSVPNTSSIPPIPNTLLNQQITPAVPIAPSLSVQHPVLSSGSNTNEVNVENDDGGDLSLPESVSSDDD
ncbi:hypothetical protein HANVADRAFT_47484 [Hanseniaspora valbyensis NRRL Y-1626]|uniref:Actin cytoskeleton-regulatory complex protein PAN1 n=1 Tax=Hanseniaspora valbyensis NRRL Y-1626 TaxID=766949 RepID=A0A1B7THZ5_9ASCO|nr:hypothetical protein HANVADRAFT_47484 [Hanseniaspora valbyensis NRRL Y-1626]